MLLTWALARCKSEDVSCRAPLLARWQALEPGNAAAWHEDLMHRTRPAAAVLVQMAAGDRFVLHFGALAALVAKAPPADMLPYLRQALVIDAVGIEAAIGLPALSALASQCKPAAAAGSVLQRQCDQIAGLMVDKGDTLLAHGVGLRLGERAGWPAARVAAARAEMNAAYAAPGILPADDQPLGCAAVTWTLTWFDDVSRLGEVGLMRQRLAAASAPR